MLQIRYTLFYILILSLFISLTTSCNPQNTSRNTKDIAADSAAYYLENYKILATEVEAQNAILRKAKAFNDNVINDTLKKINSLKIAYEALKNKDTILLKKANNLIYQLALKQKDTSSIGEYHWNMGAFYDDKEVFDSAYYHYDKGHKNYSLVGNDNYAAKMQYNMALIESHYKDYSNSEDHLFSAIVKHKRLNKTKSLYKSYKLLGIIYAKKEEFENSLHYHNKALAQLNELKDKRTFKEQSLNDIGLMYRLKKDYRNSILFYNKALSSKKLKEVDISLYAKLKENLAYSMLLNGNKDTSLIRQYFYEALKLRETDNDQPGITVNKLHLAEHYAILKDTAKAIAYAKEAKTLAISLKNNDYILSSLLLLSRLDQENSSKYLSEHVVLTNHLAQVYRNANNKFARIRFETDEYIEENEKLTLRQSLILTIAFGSVSFLTLLYFMRMQRAKNKELKFEQQQRKANEEIYKLMLKQQSILEEGRLNERNRISEELHDGVLGRIFGTRMGLAFLNIEGDKITQNQYQKFIQELQDIEKEMRIISHDLKNEILTSKTNFISIIENFLKEQNQATNIKYTINRDSYINWNMVGDDIKLNIYRIIQEAIQNINKHAKNATMVTIKIAKREAFITLNITDNGSGFDNSKTKKEGKGIGLKNMTSRANALNGRFSIESQKNKGTKISVAIPFN